MVLDRLNAWHSHHSTHLYVVPMRIKIRVRTPKGQAAKTEKRLRKFILGMKKADKTWAEEDDSAFYWEYEGNIRKCKKIERNVAKFDMVMQMLLSNRFVKGAARKLSKDDQKQLKDMLIDQTSVEVVGRSLDKNG